MKFYYIDEKDPYLLHCFQGNSPYDMRIERENGTDGKPVSHRLVMEGREMFRIKGTIYVNGLDPFHPSRYQSSYIDAPNYIHCNRLIPDGAHSYWQVEDPKRITRIKFAEAYGIYDAPLPRDFEQR